MRKRKCTSANIWAKNGRFTWVGLLVSTLSKGRQLFRSLHDVNDNEFDEAAMKIYEAIMMFEAIFGTHDDLTLTLDLFIKGCFFIIVAIVNHH